MKQSLSVDMRMCRCVNGKHDEKMYPSVQLHTSTLSDMSQYPRKLGMSPKPSTVIIIVWSLNFCKDKCASLRRYKNLL